MFSKETGELGGNRGRTYHHCIDDQIQIRHYFRNL